MLTFSSLGLHHSSVSFAYKWHKNGPLMEQGKGQMGNVGLRSIPRKGQRVLVVPPSGATGYLFAIQRRGR